MRVFLDACVDPRVAALLAGHQVTTAFDITWHTLPDPELVVRLQDRFDAFVTIDQGFEFQHNLSRLRFAIIVVHVAKNKVDFYRRLLPALLDALNQNTPGAVTHVR